jgi:predicted ferric reductase
MTTTLLSPVPTIEHPTPTETRLQSGSTLPKAPKPRAEPANLLIAALIAITAIPAAIWWWLTTDPVSGPGQMLTEAGRLTGLAAGIAVICLTVFAARIQLLDRTIGTEQLYLWHGRFGRYAVTMVLIHMVLIVTGSAVSAGYTFTAMFELLLTDSAMAAATIAGVLFVLIGVLSAVTVRRKLPYEFWHAIHLLTYAAIVLGLVHQVTDGAQFAAHPIATAVWILAIGIPLATLLVNRLIRPILMNLNQQFVIQAIIPETPGVYSILIGGRNLQRTGALAGQFIRLHANILGLRFASNPYSFSYVGPDCWRITVAVVGDQSQRLVNLPVGTRLWLEGPMGGLVLDRKSNRPVVLVAGGIGVTPIRALTQAALIQQRPVVVIYRASTAEQLLFESEWDQLRGYGGWLQVHRLPGSRTEPGNQLDPAALVALAPMITQADVYACGSPDLTQAVADSVRTTGAHSIRTESFGW